MAENYSIEASMEANISKFKKAIQKARKVTEKFKRESESVRETELDADIKPLKRNIKKARKLMDRFKREKVEKEVDADTVNFFKKVSLLQAKAKALARDKIIIPIEVKTDKFQKSMDRIAQTIRTFSTIGQNMMGGSLLIASPAMVPILASAAGLLGSLGPMIAVAGSNMVALAASFGIAGGAAVAFGAAAVPTIAGIIDGTAEATEENKKAMKALEFLKKTWKGVQKAIAPQVAVAFKNAMMGLETAISSLEPMFKSVADSVSILSAKFNGFMSSPAAQEFFGYLNKNAAPILEKVVSGIFGLIKGFMNLTVAFAPLTDFASQGFQDMGSEFANFTKRIQKSKGLEDFINYVKTNGPKLMDIVKNIGSGLIGMFTAFGPLASDMMSGLVDLTDRFKKWGKSLSDNQQFQKFIGYIRENAPTVISLIGNITTFLVNLGIAIAPIGAKVLELVNNFFAWTSSMMEAHPWFGKMVAMGAMLMGALMMIIPPLIAVRTAFAGFPGVIAKAIGIVTPLFNTFKLMMTTGLKMLGTQFYLLGQKVKSKASSMVASFGRMIAGAAKWSASLIAKIASVIAKSAVWVAKAALHAGKVAFTFTVTMVKAAAKATASMIASMAKMIAKYAWMGAKSLAHAAKVAASWVVAMGPVGWVIATVVGLVAVIVANWDKIWSWTKKTWNNMWSSIKNIAGNIADTVSNVFGGIVDFFGGINLSDSGKAIIQSAIDGLLSMKDKILGVVDNIVGKVRDFWPFSPAKTGPLSDIHRMDFAGPIKRSIAKAKKPLERATSKLAGNVKTSFNPNLSVKASQIKSSLKGIKRSTAVKVQSAVNTNVSVNKQPAFINVAVGGQEFKAFVEDITTVQDRKTDLKRRFSS